MKILAIRDRMLDYYQRPWLFATQDEFVAAVAALINGGNTKDGSVPDYALTPEHFEIWQLGEIDVETGAVKPSLTIITNCASLIRRDVRQGAGPSGARTAPAAGSSDGQAGNGAGKGDPEHPPVPDKAPAASGKAGMARKTAGRGNRAAGKR